MVCRGLGGNEGACRGHRGRGVGRVWEGFVESGRGIRVLAGSTAGFGETENPSSLILLNHPSSCKLLPVLVSKKFTGSESPIEVSRGGDGKADKMS